MLAPRWVAAHAFDVFHVQFGFDAWTPEDLATSSTRCTPRPGFVDTVHDLRNPHHASRDCTTPSSVLLERATP